MQSKNSYNKQIGKIIKNLRVAENITQEDLAMKLNTTQSAVARMEKGEQNFTTETLSKISKVLNKRIIKVEKSAVSSSMDFVITGGKKLSGEVTVNCSKNGAMGLLCASLLNKGKTILHKIPRIEEVNRIIEVMTSIGVKTNWLDHDTLEITMPKNGKLDLGSINENSAKRTRTILMFLGPLMHLFPSFVLPHAEGCKLGKRTISAHLYAMQDLGANIRVTSDKYIVNAKGLKAKEVVMYESSDTGTENVLMLASKIVGKTLIKMASANYQVQDVCFFLQNLGVKVTGIGTSTLEVEGVKDINKTVEHYNSEDPIEAMFWITATIMTDSELTIRRVPIDFLELELLKLKVMGLKFKTSKKYKSYNGYTDLVDLTIFPSKLKALDEKIYARPFPGVNIDNLPFFVPIATKASGQTLIHDWTYENRAIYYMELVKLGADMILADPHRVYINGTTALKSAQVVSPPALRPAAIIMLGMLGAEGVSILRNVYSISRGYENIAERLNQLGAEVKVLNN